MGRLATRRFWHVREKLRFLCAHVMGPVVICTVALILVACGDGPCPTAVQPLPVLAHEGLTRIPQVADLQRQLNWQGVTGLTAYHGVGDQQRAHLLLRLGANLYDIRTDGSALQRVTTKCQDRLAVDPGGHWGACKVTNGILLHDMTGAEEEQVLYVPGSDYQRGAPYWSPDGRLLTFLTRVSGHCVAAAYRVSFTSPVPTLVLAAMLDLERFEDMGVNGPVCNVFGPDWSPDGTEWLLNGPGMETITIIKLELLGLTQQQLRRSQGVLTPDLLNNAVHSFGGSGSNGVGYAVWEDMPNALAYEASDGWTIGQIDLTTGATTTLLTQQVAGIGVLTWIPGERRLAFVISHHSVECMPPPAELYLLTI